MSNVIHFHRCLCGQPGKLRVVGLDDNSVDSVNFIACDDCLSTSQTFLDRMRPVFAAMRAVGVPREIANETMTFLLDKIPDDGVLEQPRGPNDK